MVEINVELVESLSIHSHSRETSNMMLEVVARDTFELAREFGKQ